MTLAQSSLSALYSLGVIGCCVWALARLRRSEPRFAPLVAVYAIAVLARLAFIVATGHLVSPEPWEQEEMALNALAGRGFSYELYGTDYQAYGPPLYTLFTAFVYERLGHAPAALVTIGTLISATSAPVVYAITRRIFGLAAAVAAATLVAFHPGLLVYSGKLHELNLEVALAGGIVLSAIWWHERRTWSDSIAFGAVTAIGAMGRPTFLFAVIPFVAWSLWRSSKRRQVAARIVLAGLMAVAMLAPWTTYVSLIYGRPIFINVSGGIVFWYGNNPAATGSGVDPSGTAVFASAPASLMSAISNTDALSSDAAFRESAWKYVRADPIGFVGRTALKLAYFWTISPSAGASYPAVWRSLYVAYYAAIAALAILGVVTWWRTGRPAAHATVALASLFLAVSVLQSFFYVDGRHRWEIEPELLALTGGGLVALRGYFLSRSATSNRWRPSG